MLFTNELLKLRTVRSPWLLLIVAQLVVVAGVSGLFLDGADLGDPDTTLGALAHVGLVSLFSLVLGVMAVAGEYRHKTITDTCLSTPRRSEVIAAKLGVYTLAGVGLGIISAATALAVTAIWFAAKGASLDLGSAAVWETLLGGIGWDAAFAAIGVGLGALVRNLAGAVAAALAWIALVEGIVGQMLGDDLARWLPMRSGSALGRASISGDIDLLSQSGGGLMLLAYAALFAGLAVAVTARRDIS